MLLFFLFIKFFLSILKFGVYLKIFKNNLTYYLIMIHSKYKQVIVVRKDLKLPKGKLAVQVAHASVQAVIENMRKKVVKEWLNTQSKKVVVWVKDKEELMEIVKKAKQKGIITAIIKDAGLTVVKPGTITCAAIGPDKEEKIEKITGHLKLV